MIFKILRANEAAALAQSSVLKGSSVDLADGFIHFSTAAQVEETAARHFSAESGLWLVAVRTAEVTEALRWEPSRGGDLFPHLFAPLTTEAVVWLKPLPLGPDGHHRFPDLGA